MADDDPSAQAVSIDNFVIRPTARVRLVDEQDRVLLFRSVSDGGDGFWYPVGGGIEPRESVQQAAVRELFEETGMVVEGELIEVWRRRVIA